ncbi:MAG: hypothetical protein EBV97_11935 [Rhodobacteraceae bacterium]|nr:hypothetical protein [Paracoccaceae bacterium]
MTHQPTTADGSCIGLQHLSSILRDERAGASKGADFRRINER